jgi:hypothetical protein
MSEVALKLSQLREAADQLYRSSLQIERAVREVRLNISYLVAAGLPLTGLPPLYGDFHGVMEDWARDIMLFATRLDEAADDVERAILNANAPDLSAGIAQPKFGSSFVALMRKRRRAERELEAIRRLLFPEAGRRRRSSWRTSSPGSTVRCTTSLRCKNRALMSGKPGWTCCFRRGARPRGFDCAANRLLSFDQTLDPSGVPRVRTLEGQLDRLNQEIVDARGNIEQYRGEHRRPDEPAGTGQAGVGRGLAVNSRPGRRGNLALDQGAHGGLRELRRQPDAHTRRHRAPCLSMG